MKIDLDKYYTPDDISKKCVDFLGAEFFTNITEIIEPSAGGGSFLRALKSLNLSIPVRAFDIQPESEEIEKEDFLALKMNYKPGRLIIGNPPFGRSNNLTISFLNKSFEIAEYVAFILPTATEDSARIYKFDKHKILRLYKTFNLLSKGSHSFIVYKRPDSGPRKCRPPYPFDTFSLKHNGALMLIQRVESCEGPHRTKDAIRNLVEKDDIITCGFGTGCLFKEKPLGTFGSEEVLRIYDKKCMNM